jgi:hypothetical protein
MAKRYFNPTGFAGDIDYVLEFENEFYSVHGDGTSLKLGISIGEYIQEFLKDGLWVVEDDFDEWVKEVRTKKGQSNGRKEK